QTANFLIFGLLFIVFARVLKASLDDTRAARLGATLLTVIGLGILGCGLFRAESRPPSSMSATGLLHLVCAIVFVFALLPVATGVMTRAFAVDVRWRSFVTATGLTSFVTLTLLVGGLGLISPPGQPYAGSI